MKIGSAHRVMVRPLALLALACAVSLFIGVEGAAAQSDDINEAVNAHGVTPMLELTPAQRSAIYQEVHKDTSKVAPSRFAIHVGADVPPTIELYPLPDDIQANSPETKFYKFTGVDDEVVLVDPTKMRVIAVIGPKPKQR
jgi:Protein of unknown function (DUF1236)